MAGEQHGRGMGTACYVWIGQSLPPSWPVGTSQYGVSCPHHLVRCMSRTWTSMWLTALHWSLLTPFPNPQYQSIAARSITSLKLLLETTLYSCNRLRYDNNSTDQRSISTKLNTRWWPARKRRAAGTVVSNLIIIIIIIKRTARCFWRMLYFQIPN